MSKRKAVIDFPAVDFSGRITKAIVAGQEVPMEIDVPIKRKKMPRHARPQKKTKR